MFREPYGGVEINQRGTTGGRAAGSDTSTVTQAAWARGLNGTTLEIFGRQNLPFWL